MTDSVVLYQTNFSHYSYDNTFSSIETLMAAEGWGWGSGSWASIGTPSFGGHVGTLALKRSEQWTFNSGEYYALPATQAAAVIHFGFAFDDLNDLAATPDKVMSFYDASKHELATLAITATGLLQLTVGSTVVLESTVACSTAKKWYTFEAHILTGSGGACGFKLADDEGTTYFASSALTFGSTGGLRFCVFIRGGLSADTASVFWWGSFLIRTAPDGMSQASWGGVFVDTKQLTSDISVHWTPQTRKAFGAGILCLPNNYADAIYASGAEYNIGTGDFTVETFVRPHAIPTGTERKGIFGRAGAWYLEACGSGVDGATLRWLKSSDGANYTVGVEGLHTLIADRWMHVAVSRVSGTTYLFCDGVLIGAAADATNYYAPTTSVAVGYWNGQGVLYGFYDETRVTVGVGRYSTGFIPPTAAFGRNVTDDPSFASVVLLAGYNTSACADESSYAHKYGGEACVPLLVDDGASNYQCLAAYGRDDTAIEAAILAATGTVTFDSNPANADTLTLNGATYTFKTTLASAFDVLIGATAQATMENLVAAVNAGTGAGKVYGTGTTANAYVSAVKWRPGVAAKIVSLLKGTAGNAYTLAKSSTALTLSGATLSGGAVQPAKDTYAFAPVITDATKVHAVSVVSRISKNESGSAGLTVGIVSEGNNTLTGTEHSLSLTPVSAMDVFQIDPDTSAAPSPNAVNAMHVTFDRTT